MESCGGVVCGCDGEVVKKVYAVWLLEHWNN